MLNLETLPLDRMSLGMFVSLPCPRTIDNRQPGHWWESQAFLEEAQDKLFSLLAEGMHSAYSDHFLF